MMNKEDRYHNLYMKIAREVGEMSYAQRLHVGSVVVKDGRIISMGFNGMPTGWDNNCEMKVEKDTLVTKPEVLHAEMNALMKLARSTESGEGAVMYITHAPCLECAKGIWQAGIKEVYYGNNYRNTDGVDFLSKCGTKIEKFDLG